MAPESWYQPALVVASFIKSFFSNSSFAKSPDCGSPYIPWLAWMYTITLLSAISLSFYSMMISSGIRGSGPRFVKFSNDPNTNSECSNLLN